MTAIVKFCLGISVASSVAMAAEISIPSSLPNMPDGFGDWGAITLLAFVCVVVQIITAGICYWLFKILMAQSASILEMAKAITGLTAKLGTIQLAMQANTEESRATNNFLLTLASEIKTKPCQDPRFGIYLEHLEQLDKLSAKHHA